MNSVRLRRPRLALDQQAYRELHEKVLRRDGWCCQCCGSLRDLQVHHRQFRSLLGDDEENLINICSRGSDADLEVGTLLAAMNPV